MIDTAYFYFLRSKYTKDSNQKELVRLKDLFAESFKAGLNIGSLSRVKKSAIEMGVVGRELTNHERAVDNYILKTPSIVRGFFQRNFEEEAETLEQTAESIKKIKASILNNMSLSQREAYLRGEYINEHEKH
jgi:hypothetical protein